MCITTNQNLPHKLDEPFYDNQTKHDNRATLRTRVTSMLDNRSMYDEEDSARVTTMTSSALASVLGMRVDMTL